MAFQSKHEVLLEVKYKLKEQYPNTSLTNNMPARIITMWAIRNGKFYLQEVLKILKKKVAEILGQERTFD